MAKCRKTQCFHEQVRSPVPLCPLERDTTRKKDPKADPGKSQMRPIAANCSPIAASHTRKLWLPEDKECQDADFFRKSRFRGLEKPKICEHWAQARSDRVNTDRTNR